MTASGKDGNMSIAKRSVRHVGGVIMVTLFLGSWHVLAQRTVHENAKWIIPGAADRIGGS